MPTNLSGRMRSVPQGTCARSLLSTGGQGWAGFGESRRHTLTWVSSAVWPTVGPYVVGGACSLWQPRLFADTSTIASPACTQAGVHAVSPSAVRAVSPGSPRQATVDVIRAGPAWADIDATAAQTDVSRDTAAQTQRRDADEAAGAAAQSLGTQSGGTSFFNL
jgi:hypothetical protein